MTNNEKLESLIQQASELPGDVQDELLQSLALMRSPYLGIDFAER